MVAERDEKAELLEQGISDLDQGKGGAGRGPGHDQRL